MKKIFAFFFILIIYLLIFPFQTSARENVNYWYIKDFQSSIVVNKDSSLTITEEISADCGNASGKHGIYRVLPTRYQLTAEEAVLTPVYLTSITSAGNPIKYQETRDNSNYTVTWKIGDPNRTVKGVQSYTIVYTVKNAIRFGNSKFDEFYWNLNGNFWDIETDNFVGTITFPVESLKSKAKVDYYTGVFGSKAKNQAEYFWAADNILVFNSVGTLHQGEGITASVTFPKGIITPTALTAEDSQYYQGTSGNGKSFGDSFGWGSPYWLTFPGLILIVSLVLWFLYGRDPKINKTIVPEFDVPQHLPPMEMGMVMTDGSLDNNCISAGIINLAVKGKIKIEEVKAGVIQKFFGGKDYLLKKLNDKDLEDSELLLLNKLFDGGDEIKISSLRNKFYKEIKPMSDFISTKLKGKNLLIPRSRAFSRFYLTAAFIILFGIIYLARSFYAILCFSASIVIFIIFSILLRQRTREEAELVRQIEGFKLYMNTAEKYRQRFNEKENIFERFLPYAMVFGITKEWINKMKDIYGQDYFASYHPVWFVGGNITNFDAESFNSAITALSTNMAQTIASSPSSSGSGGGGFSGGGGGGGGGGGW